MNETAQLLREYRENGSETAFREIVHRYIDLVYSVALRRMAGNCHQARDVAQTVFTDLARKASALPNDVMLGGWLHRHTCFVAGNLARAERRRLSREAKAAHMNTLHSEADASWDEVSPLLDEAIQALEKPDRDAIILRFFERRDLRSLGADFGISEDAAQKRVSRAVEKLRQILVQRGTALSVSALGSMLAAQALQSAPAGWAAAISTAAVSALPAKAGLAAALAFLLTPAMLKFGAVTLGLAVAGAALAWRQSEPDDQGAAQAQPRLTRNENARPGTAAFSAVTPLAPRQTAGAESSADSTRNENALRLVILAADSDLPIPNVPIEYRGWEGDKLSTRKLSADRFGVAMIELPRASLTRLELTTRVEGFADTRLAWKTAEGEEIPHAYTLRLPRGVPIGGRVVDEAGRPIAGAEVRFNHNIDHPGSGIESRSYSYMAVTTDSTGAWKLSRIAAEMLRRSFSSARHSNFVASPTVFIGEVAGVEEAMRKGTHLFTLASAIVARGFVVDEAGNAVAGAKVLVGFQGEVNSRSTTSGLDGGFEITGCKPGKNLITAETPHLAPETVEVDLQPDSEPIRIVLGAGKPLRLRVVDKAGAPIRGAQLWLHTADPDLSKGPFIQADFSPKTDDGGRVYWDQAPDRELTFSIAARGYMRVEDFKVRPDGQEHTAVLPPPLAISGTVKDAQSGEPVPRFKIIAGWPGSAGESHFWSPFDRFWVTGANGRFSHSFEEPVVSGVDVPAFVFKLEADGYRPFITRTVRADEGDVRLDVELEPGEDVMVSVFNPDGSPAPFVDILHAGRHQPVRLGPSGFSAHGALVSTSGKDGKFKLQSDEGIVKVFAAHAAGFGESTPEQLQRDPVLRLQPWGRIEGIYKRRGVAVPNLRISVVQLGELPRIQISGQPSTDSLGRFAIDRIPPGRFHLATLSPMPDVPNAFENIPFQEVAIEPGETLKVEHSEEGVEVYASPVLPPGGIARSNLQLVASLQIPGHRPPAGILGDPAALQRWSSTPEIQTQLQRARAWRLSPQPDGRWKSPIVPAGEYLLTFFEARPHDPSAGPRPFLHGATQVSIPADFNAESWNAGEVELQLQGGPARR